MTSFEQDTGFKYHTLPLFAHSNMHKPSNFDSNYSYDIAFVGAKLPMKKWFNNEIMKPLQKKYNVGLFGPNWTLKDNFKRTGSKLLRMVKMPNIAKHIDKTRFAISEIDEISLYSSSKIALNFHEREPDLSQPHHIVNFRAFKIPACGGFQICDRVEGISNYFEEDELCRIDIDVKLWMEQIDHYLNNPLERKEFIDKGMERINKEHMDFHRVRELEFLLKINR